MGDGVNAEQHLTGRAAVAGCDVRTVEIFVELRADRHVLQFSPGENIVPETERIADQGQPAFPRFDDRFQFVHVRRLSNVRRRRGRAAVRRGGNDRCRRVARAGRVQIVLQIQKDLRGFLKFDDALRCLEQIQMRIRDVIRQMFPFFQRCQRTIIDQTLGDVHRRLINRRIIGVAHRRAERQIATVQGEFPLKIFDRQNIRNDRRWG